MSVVADIIIKITNVAEGINTKMKFGFIFPGQGSQSIGMGREFYENFSDCKEFLRDASNFCEIDFKNLLFSQNDKINISEFTQPAIVLNSFMAILALKNSIQISPKFCLGHSLGEFTALSISGGISQNECLKVVNLRGIFMQEACNGKNAGMMVVLGLIDDVVEEICDKARAKNAKFWAANYNCEGQIVLAGNKEDLSKFEAEFKKAGAKRALLLNMSVASHCEILQSASLKLKDEIKPLLRSNFNPVISNVTAKSYTTAKEAIELLELQLIKPVLYKQSIKNYEDDVDCFVEFGASVLKGLNKKITQKPTFSITNLKDLEEFCNFVKENS